MLLREVDVGSLIPRNGLVDAAEAWYSPELPVVLEAIEAMTVGFGVYDQTNHLVARNASFSEMMTALGYRGELGAAWEEFAEKLRLWEQSVTSDRTRQFLLHSPDGRTFQAAKCQTDNRSCVVTLVEVTHTVTRASRLAEPVRQQPAEDGQDQTAELTDRAREVITLLIRGLSMKQVARELGITARTVAFHKYRTMQVNALKSNADLLDFAIRHGLFDPLPARKRSAK